MQRLIFYGIIVAFVILLLLLIDVFIYWTLRIFLQKATAHFVNRIILCVMFLTVGIASLVGHYITRRQIVVHEVQIVSPRVPESFDGYRIAQISDLHLDSFGKEEGRTFLKKLADSIAATRPDVIVFTGDLVTLRAADAVPFRQAIADIASIKRHDGQGFVPVYSILGNHDYADYVRGFDRSRRNADVDSLILIQEEAGWHMLKNTCIKLSRQPDDSTSQKIALIGVENIGEPPFSTYGDLDKAMAPLGGITAADSLFSVLLTHNPTHWRKEVLPRTHIDLSLAGHTHATQLKIGSWSPARWKYSEWIGLYDARQQSEDPTLPYPEYQTGNPQYLYVNTGIGCVGPRVRIGIPPEISVLVLKKE
ncbi:MAG: metallophosphoesterase [Bacteroidales bacterium]|nr:metallophosphoesterase [Bacteroidales bacterium]